MHTAKLQRKAVSDSAKALEAKFFAYGVEVERLEVFKHLGRLIAYDNDDTHTVRGNLKKARRVWARISRVSRAENASPLGMWNVLQGNRSICVVVWERDMVSPPRCPESS